MYKSLLLPFALFMIIVCFAQCKHKNDDNNVTPPKSTLSGTYYGITRTESGFIQADSLGNADTTNTINTFADSLTVLQTGDSVLIIQSSQIPFDPIMHSFYTGILHGYLSAVLPPNTDSIYFAHVNQNTDGIKYYFNLSNFTGKRKN